MSYHKVLVYHYDKKNKSNAIPNVASTDDIIVGKHVPVPPTPGCYAEHDHYYTKIYYNSIMPKEQCHTKNTSALSYQRVQEQCHSQGLTC